MFLEFYVPKRNSLLNLEKFMNVLIPKTSCKELWLVQKKHNITSEVTHKKKQIITSIKKTGKNNCCSLLLFC